MSGLRRALESRVVSAWYSGAAWLWLLWPLSKLFGWLSTLRKRRLIETAPVDLPVPIVVVGGITVGGTGKTPVLIALVQALTAKGLRVGVVSRGYGGTVGQQPVRVNSRSTAAHVGDEPLLIALSCECPVVVGADRPGAAAMLMAEQTLDVVLSDDGMQHYALPRDFEICVLDGKRGVGNGHLLPMGPLREPVQRLQTVDWILEREGRRPETRFSYGLRRFQHCRTRTPMAPGEARGTWSGKSIAAVTGLGQPEQFFTSLERLGLRISHHAFPDHHGLSQQEIEHISAEIIIITEKDAVKIESFDDDRLWVLAIDAHLPSALVDTLVNRYSSHRGRECSI